MCPVGAWPRLGVQTHISESSCISSKYLDLEDLSIAFFLGTYEISLKATYILCVNMSIIDLVSYGLLRFVPLMLAAMISTVCLKQKNQQYLTDQEKMKLEMVSG